MRFFIQSALAIVACVFVGSDAKAQCHQAVCANQVVVQQVVAVPFVQQVVAPVVQLQQVVQSAPVVQQQVVQPVVQQVTVPTVPVLQYVAQPVVAVQQVFAHHHAQAVVVGHSNAFVARQVVVRQPQRFIVANRAQRVVVVNRNRNALVIGRIR